MANSLTAKVWKLDTTGTIAATGIYVSILAIHYSAGTTAGHTAVLTDSNDNEIARLSCGANGMPDHIDMSRFPVNKRTWNGLKLATLGSGVVDIYLG